METNRFASIEMTAVDVEPVPRSLPAATNTQTGSTAAVLALSTLGLAACGGSSSSSPAAPSVPGGVMATPGNNQVALVWSASTNATGYSIGRATNSAGPYASIGESSSTSFTDTSAANGTAYFYVVSASNATATSINSAPVAATPVALSRIQAARFLAQAAFGGSASDIQNLQYQERGVLGWLAQQFAIPVNPTGQLSNVAWLKANALFSVQFFPAGVGGSFWRKLISGPDVLRQKVMLALTDLFVINSNYVALDSKNAAVGYYLDQLEANAFGNFKGLLRAVSHTPAMGAYLSFLGNLKANPVTGTSPDENYAREIMQLFSIGVVQLNLDGTPIANPEDPSVPLATYSQKDVLNMAKVFTGWRLNDRSVATDMINDPSGFDMTEKIVLGQTIAAGLDAEETLEAAIAILMAHPSMAPFISRQFIQRLVTSNPSPDYVARVATVFQSTEGDMKSVITAILTDAEAASDVLLSNPLAGKLREPVVRFIQWARTFQLDIPPAVATPWVEIGDLSDPSTGLAESPLQAPNVFFFFQPGYIPPHTALQTHGVTAPEFAVTNETSVAGYMNFIKDLVSVGIGGVRPNYDALLPLVNQGGNSAALLAELNVLIAAGQLSAPTLSLMQSALDTIDVTTRGTNSRLFAALTLVMCAPEYLVQK